MPWTLRAELEGNHSPLVLQNLRASDPKSSAQTVRHHHTIGGRYLRDAVCRLGKRGWEKGTFYFFASVRGRPRGRSVNSRPMRRAVVILVKHILPRVAAVQNVVANPSDGSSCGSWYSAMLPQKPVGKLENSNKKEECPVSLVAPIFYRLDMHVLHCWPG
jgi:hypothetical protein